jgi:hypothetical protein
VNPDAPPTVRQIYALAAALCQLCDEEFPETRHAATELIERFRRELGHPQPRLEDTRARSDDRVPPEWLPSRLR